MNVSEYISHQAEMQPGKKAIVELKKGSFFNIKSSSKVQSACSFDELEKKINIACQAFIKASLKKGDKVLVFIPPSIELISTTFALFKMGAIPIFIDPGMGKENLLDCVKSVDADALIGISKIFYLKKMSSKFFDSLRVSICTDSSLWGDYSFEKIKKDVLNSFEVVDQKESDLAAILFTSGATGLPKGVEYTMGMFCNQVIKLKEIFSINSTDVDYAGYPLFSLFTLCMGASTYIPSAIDPKKPAKTSAQQLVKELKESRVTFATGAPSIWKKLAEYCEKKKIVLDDLKALVMFGAPVSGNLMRGLKKVMPHGQIYTPYGATESLPVSIINSNMILGETFEQTELGRGVCVGYPVRDVNVQIIPLIEEEVSTLKSLENYEPGEICVSSPMTSKAYHLYDQNSLSKIYVKKDSWHRMGDVGYMDEWGKLWYLGRKKHMIHFKNKNFFSVCVEGIFNSHPKIANSALIKISEMPAVAVILKKKVKFMSAHEQGELQKKLSIFAQRFEETREIKKIVFVDEFPLDTRHNIKIDRIKLSEELDAASNLLDS